MSDSEEEKDDGAVVHDEINFDFEDIFNDVDKQIPALAEVRSSAKKFNDAHRYILQKMIMTPCITLKKFNIMFIEYVVTRKLKRHPDVVKYIQATSMELRDLAKLITKTINNAKTYDEDEEEVGEHELGMRLVITSEETSPKEWVTLICEIQNSEVIGETSEMTKSERGLFLAIIDDLIENNGKVTRKSVNKLAVEKFNQTLLKAQKFINHLIKERYLKTTENNTFIELAPRLVAEMDPYLRAKYSTTILVCELCRRIISRQKYSAKCSKCDKAMHINCFNNAVEISNQNGVECPGCGSLIEKDKVLREVKNEI